MRNKGFDYIRASMAILIMLYHYTTRFGAILVYQISSTD